MGLPKIKGSRVRGAKGSSEDRYSILDAGYSITADTEAGLGTEYLSSIEYPVSSIESSR
jgi:hypothetical protein